MPAQALHRTPTRTHDRQRSRSRPTEHTLDAPHVTGPPPATSPSPVRERTPPDTAGAPTGRLSTMSTASAAESGTGNGPVRTKKHTGRWVAVILTVLALVIVVAGTKVVPDGQEQSAGAAETAFDQETFGAENFPTVQEEITERAVPAPELAAALAEDPEAAAEERGGAAEAHTVDSTTATGTVGERAGG